MFVCVCRCQLVQCICTFQEYTGGLCVCGVCVCVCACVVDSACCVYLCFGMHKWINCEVPHSIVVFCKS